MKVFLFVLLATLLEAAGDTAIRLSLQQGTGIQRFVLFLAGALALVGYGTSLNFAPIEFAEVVGLYIATLFVVFQISNYVVFRAVPTTPVIIGGLLIVTGGLIVGFWR